MSRKRRRNKRKTELLILVMLLLCVVAACYIISLSHRGNSADTEVPEATEMEAEVQEGEEIAEEAAEEVQTKADAHVYSYFGPPGDNEFSFDAYDGAIESGAKTIRAAMVVSADDTAYVAEDDYAMDMTGYGGYFSGMVESQIKNLTTKSGGKVLKVSDLFDKYGDSVTYIIDIKYIGSRNNETFEKIVRKSGLEDNIICASSFMDTLSIIDSRYPEMPKIYMCNEQASFEVALEKDSIDTICVTKDMISKKNLKAAHDHGKKLCASLLNSEKSIRNAIDTGLDSYFTDDTVLAIGLEEQYREE